LLYQLSYISNDAILAKTFPVLPDRQPFHRQQKTHSPISRQRHPVDVYSL
jgi:hypothetical protein